MEKLSHDTSELWVCPEIGGSVAAFNINGRPILRDGRGGSSPLDMASFPMIPFPGRIENGIFEYADQKIQLPLNFPPEAHTIHGECWQEPWAITAQSNQQITLTCSGRGKNWPWEYLAQQTFVLNERGLQLTLSLTNTSDTQMPAGLGWHPYFEASGAQLDVSPGAIWDTVPGCKRGALPEALNAGPQPISTLRYDHAFDWPTRSFRIIRDDSDMAIRLSASDIFGHVVLYTPAGEPYFCAEPLSHAPNAINSGLADTETGLRHLAPGETLTGDITMSVEPR